MFREMRPQGVSCTGSSVNWLPVTCKKKLQGHTLQQQRSTSLAWSWDEPVAIGFFQYLSQRGQTNTTCGGTIACAASWATS